MQMSRPVTDGTGRENSPLVSGTVSVIIPAFNSIGTICSALESVEAQPGIDKEVIVIDDGSTDSTVSIVRRRFPGAIVISKKSGGSATARNAGLRAARGDFIAFLDADDAWFRGKLASQLAALARHPDAGFAYSSWLVVDHLPDEQTLQLLATEQHWPEESEIDAGQSGWLYSLLLYDVIIHTSTVVMRRDLALDTGHFNEELKRGQDYEYWLRMSRLARGIKIARPLSLYLQHGNNSFLRPQARNYAYDIVKGALDRWGLTNPDGELADMSEVRRALARHCRNFASLHALRGNSDLACRFALKACFENPADLAGLWSSLKIATRARLRSDSIPSTAR